MDREFERYANQFEPAVVDKAIAAIDYMTRHRWFVKYALQKDYVFYPVRAMVQMLRRIEIVDGG